jgi:hypothetical protein
MATETSLLIPAFRRLLLEAIETTKKRGFVFEPIVTLLTPLDQARLWKQGRTAIDAELKSLALENVQASYLADCIRTAKVHETNLVTNDIPGQSWHQWGEAATVVWIDNNQKLNYSPTYKAYPTNLNGYAVFGEEAVKLGLVMSRYSEVQLRPKTPEDYYNIKSINDEMQKRYKK